MPQRIESRITRTDFTPEAAAGTIPSGATASWQPIDLNSYSDASVTYDQTARSVMTAGRNKKKGSQTDKTATFGYNIDNAGLNTLAQISSFMFNVPVERGVTRSILHGASAVTTPRNIIQAKAAGSITLASTGAALFTTNDIIVLLDGVNDRTPLKVSGAVTTSVPFTPLNAGAALDVASPLPARARLARVGRVITESLSLQGAADKVTLTATTLNWSTLSLKIGEWIHVGGDNGFFAGVEPFYARISAINGLVLTFDSTTRPISTVAVAATNVEIFYGHFVSNGDTAISFTHARYFGKDDNNKHLREFFTGCFASEMAINFEEKALVTCDFTYNCMDGLMLAMDDATHAAQFSTMLEEYADSGISTVTDIVRQRIAVQKAGVVNPAAIHGFIKSGTINVNNNLTMESAQGVLGSIGAAVGDFDASGSVSAYFIDSQAVDAIRCNCTVGMDIITARANSGFVLDMPAFTLGNGAITLEKGQSAMIDLDQAAFGSSKFGYTLSYTYFPYLPKKAMPVASSACDC